MTNTKWFLASRGKGYGPFSSEQLRQLTETGIVDHDDLVWREGDSDSFSASSVKSEPPPLPAAEPRPSPLPLPATETPASSRPNRLMLWLSLSAVLLAILGCGGWFAYDRGWLPFRERLDVADASVAESASASNESDEDVEEPDSPDVEEASDTSPAVAEIAPQSFHDLDNPLEETAPEATEPVTLPVPVLYLPCDSIPPGILFKKKGGRYAAGKIGRGVSFDGSNYTELEASLPLGNAPRTLALWVRSDKGAIIGKTPFIVTQTKNWERARAFGFIDSMNGNWRFQDMNGDLDSGIRIDREWHHLAVTHDGMTTRFYLDAKQVAQANRKLETETRRLRIGGLGSSKNNFVGLVDEIYVFDVPLTKSQIRQLMNEEF